MTHDTRPARLIRVGMVGLGMIFEETYLPLFLELGRNGIFRRDTGLIELELAAAATRSGSRFDRHRASFPRLNGFSGPGAVEAMLQERLAAVCIATPDDRHFDAARKAIDAGVHVLIEKPSVLSLSQFDELIGLARQRGVVAKVVYHKLLDPDHKKLRTHVVDQTLQHVNSGYCSLLEPKSISGTQFAEWISGRNPASYVAVHYIKLIDFTFGPSWRLTRIGATGQRGIVGPADGSTWDSVQQQIVYTHPDGREAAFDIHTSWVSPENFPGYVDQEVQFRFDNGVWLAHQRKRGVEMVVEGRTAVELKTTPNHHYNADVLEPWGERHQRGYGIEVLRRFFEEVAFVEFGGPAESRPDRLAEIRKLCYNDLSADRNTVACVQALEAILAAQAQGASGSMVTVNSPKPGLWLWRPGEPAPDCLYPNEV